MKLIHQLHLDALATNGTPPIQLTIIWEGNRLRVGTEAVVRPEHWDEKAKLVKVQATIIEGKSQMLDLLRVGFNRPN
jgi:hypothetical protein